MNTSALIVMLLSMTFLWGGLALAIYHLLQNPDGD